MSCRSPITGELAVLHQALASTLPGRSDADITVIETLPSLWSLDSTATKIVASRREQHEAASAVWIGFSDGSVSCFDGSRESPTSCMALGTLPAGPSAPARSVTFDEPVKQRRGGPITSTPGKGLAATGPAISNSNRAVTAIDRGGDDNTYSAHGHGAIYRWTLATEMASTTAASSSGTSAFLLVPTLYVQLTTPLTCMSTGTLRTSTDIHLLASGTRGGSLAVWVLGAALGDDGLPKHADLQLPRQGGKKQIGTALSLEFSSSSEFLWSGHDDGRIVVWNVRFRTCVGNIDLHKSPVTSITAIGTTMWSVSHLGECIVFDQETRVEMQRFHLFPIGASNSGSSVRLQRVAQAEGCIVWGTDNDKIRAIFVPEIIVSKVAAVGKRHQSLSAAPRSMDQTSNNDNDKSLIDFELVERSAQIEEFLFRLSQLLEDKLAIVAAASSISRTTIVREGDDDAAVRHAEEVARLQEELVLLHESLHSASKLNERQMTEIALLQAEKEQSRMAQAKRDHQAAAAATTATTIGPSSIGLEAGGETAVQVFKDLATSLEKENTELNDQIIALRHELASAHHHRAVETTEASDTAEGISCTRDGDVESRWDERCSQLTIELNTTRVELEQRCGEVQTLTERLAAALSESDERDKNHDRTVNEHVSENKLLVAQLGELTLLLAERQKDDASPPPPPAATSLLEEELAASRLLAEDLEKQLTDAVSAKADVLLTSHARISELEDEVSSLRDDINAAADNKERLEKALLREVEAKRSLEAEIQRLQSASTHAQSSSSVADLSEALNERLQRQLESEREQFASRLQDEEARAQVLERRLNEALLAQHTERLNAVKLSETLQTTEVKQNEVLSRTLSELQSEVLSLSEQLQNKNLELQRVHEAHAQELALAKALVEEARRRPTSWPRSTQTEHAETVDAEVEANSGIEESLRKDLGTVRQQLEAAEAQLSEMQLQGRDRVASEASVRVEYEERLSALHKQVKDLTLQLHGLQLVSTTNDTLRERLVVLETFERENVELRRRLQIADGEPVELSVTAEEHQAVQQENSDLRKQLQIHKHHVTKLLENEILMEKRLTTLMKASQQSVQSYSSPVNGGRNGASTTMKSPTNGFSGEESTSASNRTITSGGGVVHPAKGPRSISQLLQSIAPAGQQQHDPSDPHHRSQCMWCSGRIQQSLGGSFGIFAASPNRTRATAGRQRSMSPPLSGTLGGALADSKVADRISRLERARDATSNQQIRSAIVAELLSLHKSVLPGDY